MIEGIDVVFIHVKNPDMMARWYSEILGLEISFKTPSKDWQESSFSNISPTRFALDYAGDNPSEIERQPIMISFRVSDIYESVEKLSQKNVQFIGEEKIMDVGPSLVATFKDPEGNFLQLSCRKK